MFLGYFSKARTEECDQKNWNLSDKFGMIMHGWDIYSLEINAHLFLKVASNDSFRDKETRKM